MKQIRQLSSAEWRIRLELRVKRLSGNQRVSIRYKIIARQSRDSSLEKSGPNSQTWPRPYPEQLPHRNRICPMQHPPVEMRCDSQRNRETITSECREALRLEQ